jgi:elongation factor P
MKKNKKNHKCFNFFYPGGLKFYLKYSIIEKNLSIISYLEVILMYSAGDFRNGLTFEMEGAVYSVVEFQHVKPGKGAAFVRTKIRNVVTGSVVERTFSPTEKFPAAFVERKDMEYLYNDGELYYFMDTETYEQMPLNADILPDNFKFVKENTIVKILSVKGNVFSVEPPFFMDLKVTETEPAVRGDTSTNALKYATLETGAEIRVPLFIEEGETIRIDTRTGEYLQRA